VPVDPGARRRRRREWWTLFAAFLAVFGAWSLSTPLFAGTDESAHAVRAAAAARGEWVGDAVLKLGWHMDYDVPEAYARTNEVGCFSPRAPMFVGPERAAQTPECLPSFEGGSRLVRASSYEFRGLPVFYTVVGLPTLAVPDGTGVYLMRLAGAAGCAALAASAVQSALARRRSLPMLVGTLLALTPGAVYLASLVNPNGMEIVATIALFATLLALADPEPLEDDDRLVGRAGVALIVLVLLRAIDPFVAALAIVAFVALAGAPRARAVWERVDVRRWLAVALGLVVLHGVWVATVALGYGEERDGHGLAWAAGRWDDLLRESVGVLGANDVRLPMAVYVVWALVAVAAIGAGLVVGSTAHRALVGALVGLATVLAIGVDGYNLPPLGFDWQGRYGLPLLAGAALVALDGVARSRRALGDPGARIAGVAAVVALLAGQLVAFVATARVLGVGRASDAGPLAYLFDAAWEPALPPLLLLLVFAVGLAGVGVVARAAVGARRTATVRG
jgi:hypothetical protein